MDINNIKKEYSNGEVTIVWQSGLCQHAANCVKNNPAVFKPKDKPWIHPEASTTAAIIDAVKTCPSGALTFYLNEK
ncbi:(4Fe-4S)-binding protein [Ferruginibacter yonginensis]|uniref:(4Fe-4S)-binding protein n=1 Tax=Ferruginibacter yonginensis TaxID=1310416 RepID=A0ABV8QMR3_9BACT